MAAGSPWCGDCRLRHYASQVNDLECCLGCEMEARFGDGSEVGRAIRAFEELVSAKPYQI